MSNPSKKEYLIGLLAGASAFTIWGLLPLYWQLVKALTPYQISSQRVLWSLVFLVVILLAQKQFKAFVSLLKTPAQWRRVMGPALFISINWLTYIWSVNSGYVIEASLGYFINPLVLTLFGFIFYKEKLTKLQLAGFAFAIAGVLYKTFIYGKFPVIAFVLAVSFALYGLLKKKSALDSIKGLGFETFVIGLPAFGYLLTQEMSGTGITGRLPWSFWLLIALSGIVTASPLILYAESAKRLPLSVVGFLQYISPSISLWIGIYILKEAFDPHSLVAFSLIWIGLICFSWSQYLTVKQMSSEGGSHDKSTHRR